jgi:hypothetical protein
MYLRIARHFPLCRYDEAVAEYRFHGQNMIRNSGLVLNSDITVLCAQRQYVKVDRRSEAACRAGLEYSRGHWGDPLVERVREQVREGEWKEALRGAYLLARYHPRGLALVISDKPVLRRRLEVRERVAHTKDTQLKYLRKELQQQRRQLEERAQQLRRVRRRARKLEDREKELQRRLREVEGSGAWEILKRLPDIQGKPSQK